jgi:hypothetical protein
MAISDDVAVRVSGEGEIEEILDLTQALRLELLELDVEAVTAPEGPQEPDAKGLTELAGWLVVHLGSGESLRSVIDTLRSWVGRQRCDVEVSLGGDVLKLSAVTSDQRDKIIDAWLARHSGDA